MGRGSTIILAIAIVIASLIIGAFNRYEILAEIRGEDINDIADIYKLDKLTGQVCRLWEGVTDDDKFVLWELCRSKPFHHRSKPLFPR